jgi:dTDP-4-amino-4,6-dideoxygalactose transaminase
MFSQLPPAGDPIALDQAAADGGRLEQIFQPWSPRFYASGTAALGACIRTALSLRRVKVPEVILPAYGCPDLVSAALFAGARPVLVDLEADRPWMDLEQVAAHISPSTVAIVAVNLFGIPERLTALRELIGPRPIVLIEDSAQAFPTVPASDPWQGDLVVLSFGRGKPVNLLGGGAALYRDSALGDLLPLAAGVEGVAGGSERGFRTQARLYNLFSQPWLYWIPHGLAFLRLGETRYQPLSGLQAMPGSRLRLLAANIEAYQKAADGARGQLAAMLAESREELDYLIDLPKICGLDSRSRLLRYPLLVAADRRDQLLRRLNRHGLGATGMYPSILPAIAGLESLLQDQGPFPVAKDFARRIVTLPVHSRVRSRDVKSMGRILTGRP